MTHKRMKGYCIMRKVYRAMHFCTLLELAVINPLHG